MIGGAAAYNRQPMLEDRAGIESPAAPNHVGAPV